MPTVTAMVDDDLQHRLTAIAQATQQSPSCLISTAIRRYIEKEEWQIAAIEKGLQEAEAGNFATEEEVKDFFAKWGVDAH